MTTATSPVRPESTALDALFAIAGVGAARFTPAIAPGIGFDDAALRIYATGISMKTAQPINVAWVPIADVEAAKAYQDALVAAASQNGGFNAGESPNETPIPQSAVQSNPSSDSPTPSSSPVAIPTSSPSPATSSALPPLTPGAVITPVHHNIIVSLLGTLAHGVASAATPSNLETIAQIIAMFSARK